MSDKRWLWENVTSYSRGEDKTEVRSTRITAGELRITVTKHVGFGDELVMHCPQLEISTRPLETEDMAEGQREALAIVEARVAKISYALTALQQTDKGEQDE